jgi:hypothetical protein
MKNSLFLIAILSACMGTYVAGCNRKPDAKSELEKAAATLEKSDPAPAAPAQSAVANPVPVAPAAEPARTIAAPSQQMRAAIAAYKAGNLEDAVTRLQKLRATPVMSPEQRIAVNDAMAAVMNEIATMAAKGDARAIAAAKQYEEMQTRRQ